ncbi:hypothetical protein [Micromonospora siamensis]|uniref:Uncharacterized protein n=1 Tax=Micromonospora siamensis TaxID=299152 RepID=A0A1C5JUZ5_9ACTN|nr:hypothetical protein [Micromonospora siamensis]SCG74420.1 hypothetical protein GA0074704_5032 [Micromonospora siamensis]
MSDAHLTERPLDGGPEPIELTDEPIRLSHRDPEEYGRRPRSRGRRVALGVAGAVLTVGVVASGVWGWQVLREKDTRVDTPARLAGLERDDSERALNTADYLRSGFAADIDLDRSFGTVYREKTNAGGTPAAGAGRSVLVFGGTTLLWQPERDLDSLFGLMADETGKVGGLRAVDAGDLGGVMKCGTTEGDGGDFAICGWADHGSVAMAMFPGRTVDDAGSLFRQMRAGMQTR